jgi:protein-tyrosine phosphatase
VSVGDALEIDASRAVERPYRILFVCLGNICRSPTAEGVMRELVREAGLQERIELDSAGTGDWHIDEPPDARASATAQGRGITLEGAARQVQRSDFREFDLIVAMDASNLANLRHAAPEGAAGAKIVLLRQLDPPADGRLDVPDPYHGGARGFEDVFDLVHAACAALLARVRATLPDALPNASAGELTGDSLGA